ncbi:MAG: hypothetical protein ABSD41_13375 [Candidatus Bathyarchaeia archaeon]
MDAKAVADQIYREHSITATEEEVLEAQAWLQEERKINEASPATEKKDESTAPATPPPTPPTKLPPTPPVPGEIPVFGGFPPDGGVVAGGMVGGVTGGVGGGVTAMSLNGGCLFLKSCNRSRTSSRYALPSKLAFMKSSRSSLLRYPRRIRSSITGTGGAFGTPSGMISFISASLDVDSEVFSTTAGTVPTRPPPSDDAFTGGCTGGVRAA